MNCSPCLSAGSYDKSIAHRETLLLMSGAVCSAVREGGSTLPSVNTLLGAWCICKHGSLHLGDSPDLRSMQRAVMQCRKSCLALQPRASMGCVTSMGRVTSMGHRPHLLGNLSRQMHSLIHSRNTYGGRFWAHGDGLTQSPLSIMGKWRGVRCTSAGNT